MANLSFKKKDTLEVAEVKKDTWKVLISDDEEDIHLLTKAVLKNFTYKNKSIEFISAYSGADTVEVLKERDDVALVLLDVIMESDDAGLKVVKRIREDLENDIIQIILRTGQPGMVPENKIVVEYAINDYKEKTELTANKLVTTITTAIRSYENLKKTKKLNHELNNLIACFDNYVIASKADKNGEIIYVSEAFKKISGYLSSELIGKDHNILSHEDTQENVYTDMWSVISSDNVWRGEIKNKRKDGTDYWLYTIINPEYDVDGNFLYYTAISHDITAQKDIEVANKKIENLNIEIEETQKEVVFRIGSIAEARSKETGMHVKRVAEYSKILASYYGLDESEADILRQASPMHDIGKVAIPDNILNKPGSFTPEEFEIMKSHAELGYEMLKSSHRPLLKLAATVAYEHHEKWDGTGYPQGLKGRWELFNISSNCSI